jgi:transcriptional regulator with XRE-family HTH domain
MPSAPTLVRDARRRAGLTQAQLAERLGVSQVAVARLEKAGANPTVDTLARALWATGSRLELSAGERAAGVDESLVRQQLERSPAERLRQAEDMYEQSVALAGAASPRR